ncbi:unnamed protein product [Closterium sp. Yama58-4]|nr:unnamed protein product [Closterium sp. Yama58-4]
MCMSGIAVLLASSAVEATDVDINKSTPQNSPPSSSYYIAQPTSGESQGTIIVQIPDDPNNSPGIVRVIMAGTHNPPTKVTLSLPAGDKDLAMEQGQWKQLAPGVWDQTRAVVWSAGVDGQEVTVEHHGTQSVVVSASGTFSPISAVDLALAVLPTMSGGRFEVMFSGATAGGARIRIANATDTKVTLEVHLVFTNGVTTDSTVSLMGNVGAQFFAPLALECPFTSDIEGVFACAKTIDVDIPAGNAADTGTAADAETAAEPNVPSLQDFMGALVGATMSGDYQSPLFSLVVNEQSATLYYAL